jgi:lysophospholipase
MTFEAAPFFAAVSKGPPQGAAFWAQAVDGVRLRIGVWPLEAARGTVLIFPGRTEYVEKYGQIAAALGKRGFASLAIDWRGQGLADRIARDPLVGHVEDFLDYQKDVAAALAVADAQALPGPRFLIAHSMGGAIGLRALIEGLPVRAAAFSGPMWGISMAPHLKPAAWLLSQVMPRLGQGEGLPPGTKMEHHIMADGFAGNMLTRDPEQFEIMRQQLVQHPELTLGGPSYVWLREAMAETRALSRLPSPALPCLAFLGSNERIVDVAEVHRRMTDWPQGRLQIVENGEHEVLMEGPAVTEPIFDQIAALFSQAAPS